MVMMALFGFLDAVGKRAELSPAGEEREVFWWTKGTLREEFRPCVNARTNDPPTRVRKDRTYLTVQHVCKDNVVFQNSYIVCDAERGYAMAY